MKNFNLLYVIDVKRIGNIKNYFGGMSGI